MGPYQVMSIIVGCLLSFAAVVAFLTHQGVPVLVAFLGVYGAAVGVMLAMQRRARQLYDSAERSARGLSVD